ncbi:hypothetical protein QP858_06495 [Trueperella bernardiae]|uniref:Uncharacterized protein n=1 Tax=Trueperella bernardiae TaxID=59561 RepID=A0AAW6ZDM8_9ACTO|nr:hypothetical protein [Trueperella bernardiae]MDK8602101.1 hypothetical protein [Trueperella bernardiae]
MEKFIKSDRGLVEQAALFDVVPGVGDLAGMVRDLVVEVERLKAALIAPVEPTPVEPTPVEQVEQVDRFAGVPNLTAKMRERLARALDRGLAPTAAVEYATGTLKGKRSASLLEVLTGGGEK